MLNGSKGKENSIFSADFDEGTYSIGKKINLGDGRVFYTPDGKVYVVEKDGVVESSCDLLKRIDLSLFVDTYYVRELCCKLVLSNVSFEYIKYSNLYEYLDIMIKGDSKLDNCNVNAKRARYKFNEAELTIKPYLKFVCKEDNVKIFVNCRHYKLLNMLQSFREDTTKKDVRNCIYEILVELAGTKDDSLDIRKSVFVNMVTEYLQSMLSVFDGISLSSSFI